MALPLPHVIVPQPETGVPVDAEAIQANFDAIKKEFPLSRKDLKIETPHLVGGTDEPIFQGTWTNYSPGTFRALRFWKDPMGLVHIEGAVTGGAAAPSTIFILPAKYRPGDGLTFVTHGNRAIATIDIAITGNVVLQSGSSTFVSLFLPPFKQEL
jgi:hypothetical protein